MLKPIYRHCNTTQNFKELFNNHPEGERGTYEYTPEWLQKTLVGNETRELLQTLNDDLYYWSELLDPESSTYKILHQDSKSTVLRIQNKKTGQWAVRVEKAHNKHPNPHVHINNKVKGVQAKSGLKQDIKQSTLNAAKAVNKMSEIGKGVTKASKVLNRVTNVVRLAEGYIDGDLIPTAAEIVTEEGVIYIGRAIGGAGGALLCSPFPPAVPYCSMVGSAGCAVLADIAYSKLKVGEHVRDMMVPSPHPIPPPSATPPLPISPPLVPHPPQQQRKGGQ